MVSVYRAALLLNPPYMFLLFSFFLLFFFSGAADEGLPRKPAIVFLSIFFIFSSTNSFQRLLDLFGHRIVSYPPPLGIARGRSAWQFGLSHRVDEFVLFLMDNAPTRVQLMAVLGCNFIPVDLKLDLPCLVEASYCRRYQ